jgi:AmiR/NasT family two-component response regulator
MTAMSIAPESLAASRFRELRKLDEKVQKLSQDLAEA